MYKSLSLHLIQNIAGSFLMEFNETKSGWVLTEMSTFVAVMYGCDRLIVILIKELCM